MFISLNKSFIAAVLAIAAVAGAQPPVVTLVACSPGSPGTTSEAQPRMDAFAAALSAKAGVTVTAIYEPSDAAGAKRLADAGLGLVSLPFFVAHEHELGLHARLQAVPKGRPALESWVLVAGKGRVTSGSPLDGFTIASSAGFAPAFVRGVVLGKLVTLPATAKIVQSVAVLSALRKAADGQRVAVVLDPTQAAALPSLPYADKLEIVARSPAVPTGLVVTIDHQLSDRTWQALEPAFTTIASSKPGAAALEGLEVARFEPIDAKALGAVEKATVEASR